MERFDQDICARQLVELLPSLRNRAVQLKRNRADAEDLVQATAVQVLRHWRRFLPGTNFRAWAHRIQLNLHLEDLRRTRETSLDQRAIEAVAAPGHEALEVWRAFELDDMRAALPAIAPPLRVVLDAHLDGETSYRSLGQRFGIPVATVATRIHRGRQRLRRVLLAARLDARALGDPAA